MSKYQHLQNVFPELYDVLNKGWDDPFKENSDGSISCLSHPDPTYFNYELIHSIYCTSHEAYIDLYVSGCGNYKGALVHYNNDYTPV